MKPSVQTRLLVVQLLAIVLAVAGDVAGSRFVTATGVTAFFIVLVGLVVTLASQRLTDVADWVRTRPTLLRRTNR